MLRPPLSLIALLCAVLCAAVPATAATPRIVGGHTADIAAWPFLVAVVQGSEANAYDGQYCGGAIVAPTLVLTAAHCLDTAPMDVVAGRATLSQEGGERISVIERRLPPRFDAATNDPDLALLVLERPAAATPIAIAGPADAALETPGTIYAVAGWGVVRQRPRTVYTDTLIAGTLRARPGSACHDAFWGFVRRTMLCAGTPRIGTSDACQGDSGGPLVAATPAGPRLVAVVSWGAWRCGDRTTPGVYARVISQNAWLAGEIARSTPPPAAVAPVTGIHTFSRVTTPRRWSGGSARRSWAGS